MGLAAVARRNSSVGCDRRDGGVSHTCGVATLSMILCGKSREYVRASQIAKLSADLLLGRHAAAFTRARERERERKRKKEGEGEREIESDQPGK